MPELGLGRHWHFRSVQLWMPTGAVFARVYVFMVIVYGLPREFTAMVLGRANATLTLIIGLAEISPLLVVLCLEMKREPLPMAAWCPAAIPGPDPARFQSVRSIKAIEAVDSYHHVGRGQGGWREDQHYYATAAGI